MVCAILDPDFCYIMMGTFQLSMSLWDIFLGALSVSQVAAAHIKISYTGTWSWNELHRLDHMTDFQDSCYSTGYRNTYQFFLWYLPAPMAYVDPVT